ncbi:MAG: HDIG domain-containing protein [Anaerolineae bacterium]|nr:HDIG domain-containing protein [Anaerolineae bacterium]
MRWARVRHRVAQFLRALKAWFQPVDIAYAQARLAAIGSSEPGRLLALFTAMRRADRHHGIEVARALEQEGLTDPALLAAALLHDVGKVRAPVGIFARVFVVLGEHFAPALARDWSDWSPGEQLPHGLRRGFVVRRHHAAWGAALALEAGVPPETAAWIRRHHDPAGPDRALAALQRADET